MKQLKLTSETDHDKFEVLFNGFIVGGSRNTQKGIQVLRRELIILDKLEAISKPCECGKKVNEEIQRELLPGPQSLTLEDNEFDLLYTYISDVPWATGKYLRTAMTTLDWMRA